MDFRLVEVMLAAPLFFFMSVLVDTTALATSAPSPIGYPRYIKCTVWGGAGNDILVGTTGNDIICGQGGNDLIRGRGGRDQIYGGSGNDRIYGGNTATNKPGYDDQIYGDGGADRLLAGGGADHVEGHGGDDYIEAGAGDDYVKGDHLLEHYGLNGADTIYGGPGTDSISSGGGNDFVDVGTADRGEVAHGGSGNDILLGGTAAFNFFWGDAGSDLLFPATLRKSVLGNAVTGGDGNDIAILVNGAPDGFIMGPSPQKVSVPMPGGCQVDVPISNPNDNVRTGSVSCKLIGPVSIKVDGSTVSLGSDFYSQSVSWDPRQWRQFANKGLSSLKGDLCVCDPPQLPLLLGDQVY